MADCIFCSIVEGEEFAHKVWESEQFLAFLSIHPCNPGHTLLIPISHVDYVFDLVEPLYSDLSESRSNCLSRLEEQRVLSG